MPINQQPIGKRAVIDPAVEAKLAGPGLNNSSLAEQEQATHQAIGWRRKQRWIFYGIFILLFLGALFLIIKVYNDNSKLLANVNDINLSLQERQADLERVRQNLSTQEQQLEVADASLEQVQTELQQKINDLQTAVTNNDELQAEIKALNNKLTAAEANVVNLILLSAVKTSQAEMDQVALADVAPDGQDSDGDGLADALEIVLTTDPNKTDTDDDGYNDQDELIGGFDPLGSGKLALDNSVADKYQEKIVLQDDQVAWYVAANGKKYFLGTLADKFSAMRYNPYWTRSQ